jgi:hypothetical protein
MPIRESPGGLVPAIITAWNPLPGYGVQLDAQGTDGATATCVGDNWHNPIRKTYSRSCYVQLPLVAGAYNVRATAVFSAAGKPDVVVDGVGPRAIQANGFPSAQPMTIAVAQQIERCGNPTANVQLTIDDSIDATKLRFVLRTLAANGVRATFFLNGKFAHEHPQLMRTIRRHGHWVGNHSYSHPALIKVGDETVLGQIDRGVAATTKPRLLRPPYGAGAFTTRLADLAAQRSYTLCRWTNVPYDWEASATAEVLIERVRYGDYRTAPIEAGGMILLHGHGHHTMEAIQGIIDVVRARGLEFEPLP